MRSFFKQKFQFFYFDSQLADFLVSEAETDLIFEVVVLCFHNLGVVRSHLRSFVWEKK